MQIGDLVMWIGGNGIPDEWHGDLGLVVSVVEEYRTFFYDVQWYDGTLGKRLRKEEIMVINNEVSER
jgi:hypothetical protein